MLFFFFEFMNLKQKLNSIISKARAFFPVRKQTKEEKRLSEIGFTHVKKKKASAFINHVTFDRLCPDDNIAGVFAKYLNFRDEKINGKLFIVLVKLPLSVEQLLYTRDTRPSYFAEVFYFRDNLETGDRNFHGIIEINTLDFIADALSDMDSLYAIALSNYASSVSTLKTVGIRPAA